jgi:hypothetical protein|tara:strand:- start:782 stop:961 length:180 start_codon:yes stop_codon:yes gene_type:complete
MKNKWHNISIKKESFEELQKIQESAPVKISLSQTIDWLISVGQAQIKSELRKTINVNEL